MLIRYTIKKTTIELTIITEYALLLRSISFSFYRNILKNITVSQIILINSIKIYGDISSTAYFFEHKGIISAIDNVIPIDKTAFGKLEHFFTTIGIKIAPEIKRAIRPN